MSEVLPGINLKLEDGVDFLLKSRWGLAPSVSHGTTQGIVVKSDTLSLPLLSQGIEALV